MKGLQQLFAKFKEVKVGVIGDVMLDTYMWGHVDRISPEAPVPIVSLDKKEYQQQSGILCTVKTEFLT